MLLKSVPSFFLVLLIICLLYCIKNGASALTGCRASDFICESDQTCISGVGRCDGEKDCHDGSDEKNCTFKPCPNSAEFRCALGRCIPLSWRCDRVVDCSSPDTSDEDNCAFTCMDDEFKCGGIGKQECISQNWVCDGEQDCSNGSDEHDKCFMECKSDEFKCMNHHCIQQRLLCNGLDDCGDNSDEAHCSLFGTGEGKTIPYSGTTRNSSLKCTSDTYRCFSGECLDFGLVCDGKADCQDGSDEGQACLDSCGLKMECFHTCHRTPRGPKCSCPPGFRISPNDIKSCEDIDECVENVGMCDHYCINLKGGFKCTCHHEYILKPDHKTCKSKGNPPKFLYESDENIFVASQDLLSPTKIELPTNVSGFAVDARTKNIYWTNAERGTIGCVNINPNFPPEVLIIGLSTPTLIAYDWISNNAFIAASSSPGGRIKIWICSLSKNPAKRTCASLYPISGDDVTGIAVAPQQNFIVWANISFVSNSFSGAIMKGEMGGTRTIMLAADKVINPRGIAVDYVFKRVFWMDSLSKTIEVVNFDGEERRTVISSGISDKVGDGVAVFENWVMWIDGGQNIRCRTDMLPECIHLNIQSVSGARSLNLLQPSLQPRGKDPCENNSCDFICTTSQSLGLESKSIRIPKCLCPQGFASDDLNNFNCTKMRSSSSDSDSDSGNDIENGRTERESLFSSKEIILLVILVLFIIISFTVAAIYFYKKKDSQPKIHARPYIPQWSSPLL